MCDKIMVKHSIGALFLPIVLLAFIASDAHAWHADGHAGRVGHGYRHVGHAKYVGHAGYHRGYYGGYYGHHYGYGVGGWNHGVYVAPVAAGVVFHHGRSCTWGAAYRTPYGRFVPTCW